MISNKIKLDNVTIVGVDCVDLNRLNSVIDYSCTQIDFGGRKILSSINGNGVTKINHIASKQDYSKFMVNELYKYIDTEFMLVVQYDGYVLNPSAWNPEWLNYDYIGATWDWYNENCNGNGGFSLRSKKLMQAVAEMKLPVTHPEDDVICRVNRKKLEQNYGIKFAPIEVCKKFSIEGYGIKPQFNVYNGEFGFHGNSVSIPRKLGVNRNLGFRPQRKTARELRAEAKQIRNTNKKVILQAFGIGDIIFCQTIANSFIDKGEKLIWPVLPQFYEQVISAYPRINFVLRSPVSMEIKQFKSVGAYDIIPLRFSDTYMGAPYKDVMRAKYDMMGMDYTKWKDCAMYERDFAKEQKLAELVGADGEYTLVNRYFTGKNRSIEIPDIKGRVVEMNTIKGYSLFDWSTVIENATEIHTVSTSIVYLFELLTLKCKPHIYVRRPIEKDHSYYDYLLKKPYNYV